MAIEPTRTVIIYDEAGIGKEGNFKDIKIGMRFRIMESDGSGPVKDAEGCDVFIAESDSYIDEEDVWTVQTSAFVEEPEGE